MLHCCQVKGGYRQEGRTNKKYPSGQLKCTKISPLRVMSYPGNIAHFHLKLKVAESGSIVPYCPSQDFVLEISDL